MSQRKSIQVSTAGTDQSTIVDVVEGDSTEDVLSKAFDSLDETDGDLNAFQLRQGTGEALAADEDVFETVHAGEVLHASTAPTLG